MNHWGISGLAPSGFLGDTSRQPAWFDAPALARPVPPVALARAEPEVEDEHEAEAKAEAVNPRILVVEDHPSLQAVTRAMLAALGATTSVSAHGAQVVRLACASPFDLILMDLQMPTLEGLSSIRLIRSFEQSQGRARVPVVAYTSPLYAGWEPFLLGLGLDAVLEKPSSALAMKQCLLSLLPAGQLIGQARALGRATGAVRVR